MMKAKKRRKAASACRQRKPGFEPERNSLVDELHHLRDALRTQNIRFSLVLEKMRQGLCFFDGSKRLIVSNRRYAELYGIAPEAIGPGMEFREIVELRYAAGSVPEMSPAEYFQWREDVLSGGGAAE